MLERQHLMRWPEPFDSYIERLAPVSSLVAQASMRSSVPCKWAVKVVSKRMHANCSDFVVSDSLVVNYARWIFCAQTAVVGLRHISSNLKMF